MPAILQVINSSVSYKDAKAFPLMWAAAAMQIYWKKISVQLPQDCNLVTSTKLKM